MTFQADIIATLLADGPLGALIGERLWPDSAPEDAVMPFVVVWEFASGFEHTFSTVAVTAPLLQFVIYDTSYGGSLAVAEALRAALLATDYPLTFEDERSIKDMTTGIHRRDLDVKVPHV
jgi:hypothetical protein